MDLKSYTAEALREEEADALQQDPPPPDVGFLSDVCEQSSTIVATAELQTENLGTRDRSC